MKQPKKTETVEVRLPFVTKLAFMQHCREKGLTASEAIRHYIDSELEPRPRTGLLAGKRKVVGVIMAVLAVGAIAAPSLAQTLAPSRAAFGHLDLNRDGVLSFEEFRRR